MKEKRGAKKTITVKCFFKEDGEDPEKIIMKSFVSFVKSEAAKAKS